MNFFKLKNKIEDWIFDNTYTTILFNYNIKKRDIASLFVTIYILLIVFLISGIISSSIKLIMISIIIMILGLSFIKIHYDKIVFQYKFYRYFEKLLYTKSKKDDIAKFRNPNIVIYFKRNVVKVTIQSLGYFSIKDYENIANSIADILDMEKTGRIYKTHANYTALEFIPKDSPIKMNDNTTSDYIRLSQNISWNFYQIPMAMIIGTTGSGKSVLLSHLVSEVKRLNYDYFISDIKNETEKQFRTETNFSNSINGTLKILRTLNEELNKRINIESDSSKHIFFFFEEYLAFQQLLDSKQKKEFEQYFNQLLVLGRSSNIHLIVALQNPDAKNFGSSSFRSNFGLIIHLGKITQERAIMTFGVSKNELPLHNGLEIIGEGYIQYGDSIKTFISPRLE